MENLSRDQCIGEAYAERRAELESAGKLYELEFDEPGPLGFKILLARGEASSRRRVIVDETFEYSPSFAILRPNDELVAIEGDLLIEMDPEAFGELVRRLRSIRPLRLTFARGDGRDAAFQRQTCRRQQKSEIQTKAVVHAVAARGGHVDEDEENIRNNDDQLPYCICVGVTLNCTKGYYPSSWKNNNKDLPETSAKTKITTSSQDDINATPLADAHIITRPTKAASTSAITDNKTLNKLGSKKQNKDNN